MAETFYWTDGDGTEWLLADRGTNDTDRVITVQGLGPGELENFLQRVPLKDGAIWRGGYIPPRRIALQLTKIRTATNDWWDARDDLADAFNAEKGEGVLAITRPDATVRKITCRVAKEPDLPYAPELQQHFDDIVELVAPWPFFWEGADNEQDFDFSGTGDFMDSATFTFPATLYDAWVSISNVLNNQGDIPAPIVVEVYGPAGNITIENVTTGEKIEVDGFVPPGYTLTIDGNRDAFTTTLDDPDGTNFSGALSNASRYWMLARGNNTVRVKASNTGAGTTAASPAVAKVTWKTWRKGV